MKSIFIPICRASGWLLSFGILVVVASSCRSTRPVAQTDEPRVDAGWTQPYTSTPPVVQAAFHPTFQPASLPPVETKIPEIPGAELVEEDEFCAVCHETYHKAFANNVHKEQKCESCHGPASLHLESRGQEPGTILSFKTMKPAEKSAVCIRCHEQDACAPGIEWPTSIHAHNHVACTDCHVRNHYNVPEGTPSTNLGAADPHGSAPVTPADYRSQPNQGLTPDVSHNLGADSPDICYGCHADTQRLERVAHPHQIGGPNNFNCTTCHDAHGNVRHETRKQACLKCHQDAHMNAWHGSAHDLAGVACTDCHNPHPKVGLPMSVDEPNACYRCHGEKFELEEVAHPHQVCGPNNFNCSTCHNPHGDITPWARKELCLQCHDGSPTMAWHSSIHDAAGVACTDCHNPHPDTTVERVVQIRHETVRRPKRLPMSVNEPFACYKCHPKIQALTGMPSHHPILEGKVTCSDCHDAHGQAEGNLNEETVNMVCWKCHAETQGPFVYEHPPVTENCLYCHEPHGTVANNLLRQPPVFLCLRCHTGHRGGHFGGFTDIDGDPRQQAAFYTDCTQCHDQIHGSDVPSQHRAGALLR